MKKIFTLLLCVALVFGVVGCSSKPADENKKLRVGYVTMDITSPYFIKMIEGMKEKAKELDLELSIHDGKYQAQPQIDAMETLITQKVDAIVLSANDPAALQPMIDKAKEAGIKVITANVEMKNADAHVSLVEYDYGFMGGELAGKYIKEKLNGEAEVAVLTFTQVPAVLDRVKGLKEGIQSLAPKAKIVAETEAYTRELGMNAIETALQANPNLNVVVGINDDAVLGAYEAMMAAGRNGDDVVLVGLDAVEEAIKKVDEGGIYRGTVDIAPFESGKIIIDTTKKVIEEGPIDEMIKFPMTKVTPENVDQFK
ncbi:sugar ABC transporter substrate-binding protein [Crassaminicella profunda]|uniref:sugar ABC transporter substrate-binding protein n=1 Tax=Crassaminicella profunda TaxID=1286698 RepID=UPI001CA6D17C|nr:sugar ABC transporter substrate-binding protein [Crassaminicella profunda]QZY54936.1 sugar ABC transporter substrate-binding protein [Crassaminicella profunda]